MTQQPRKPRGRVSHDDVETIPKVRMIFGIHRRCPICRGSGKRPRKKEICGLCKGTGIYEEEA